MSCVLMVKSWVHLDISTPNKEMKNNGNPNKEMMNNGIAIKGKDERWKPVTSGWLSINVIELSCLCLIELLMLLSQINVEINIYGLLFISNYI